MKLFDKIFGKRYLDWDEYRKKIEEIEDKHWQSSKPKFRLSK